MSKTYVFDMDGTLISSVAKVTECLIEVAKRHGIESDAELLRILTPLGYIKSAEYLIERFSLDTTVEALYDEYMEVVLPCYENVIKMRPDIKDYLIRLKAEGNRVFLFTASPHILVLANLKSAGVYDVFDKIYSVDDFGLSKANPEIYDILADEIGTPQTEILYFEDSPTALRNAKSRGYKTYAVYEEQNSLPEEVMRAEFDEFIPDLAEYAKTH